MFAKPECWRGYTGTQWFGGLRLCGGTMGRVSLLNPCHPQGLACCHTSWDKLTSEGASSLQRKEPCVCACVCVRCVSCRRLTRLLRAPRSMLVCGGEGLWGGSERWHLSPSGIGVLSHWLSRPHIYTLYVDSGIGMFQPSSAPCFATNHKPPDDILIRKAYALLSAFVTHIINQLLFKYNYISDKKLC